MKTHYKSAEIAHAWMHQLSPHGNSPGAMSFYGPLFRSYATGIGRIVQRNGKTAVIVNDRSFSVSTSKHQGVMRCAIPSETTVFHFDDGYSTRLNPTGAELFEYALDRSADCLTKAAKARVRKDWHNGQAGEWLEQARAVSAFYGLRRKVDEKAVQRLSAAKAREEKARVAREAAQAEKLRAEMQADFDAWKRGEDVHGYFRAFPVAFRVEGDELVSSLGARVLVKDAKVALRFVQSRKGQEWRENGETCPVGGYRVNSITPAGIVAGCHRIAWDEIAHVAELLNA